MKKSIEVVEQLKKYFGAVVIGSQIFIDNGLLSPEDTNDIDIAVSYNDSIRYRMHDFLKDAGFVDEDVFTFDRYAYKNVIVRTKWTHPEYDKQIDINYFQKTPIVYSVSELIKEKFESARDGDLKQILMAVFNQGNKSVKNIKELQDFYKNNSHD